VEDPGQADVGMMAIENTLGGGILENYKLINKSNLHITGEVYLRIVQNLMALPGQKIADLKEVHSHYMAIRQCKAFFKQYPHIKLVETSDTALSAKNIRENNLQGIGAIASSLAAKMYKLDMLAESIETNKKNFTRFLVLQHQYFSGNDDTQVDKATISFTTSHAPGSLNKVLSVLAAYNISLSKIQSVPIVGRTWEYMFLGSIISIFNFHLNYSSMYYLVIYELADNYLEKRAAHRAGHFEHIKAAQARGEFIMGGAFDSQEAAVLIFKVADKSVIEDFIKTDPYVLGKVAIGWQVEKWNVAIGG